MNTLSLMQQALGEQWSQLPPALQAHYQSGTNRDAGTLDIDYPNFMQPVLNALRLLGVLINRRGAAMVTTVEKHMDGTVQRWQRTIIPVEGKQILFNSYWVYVGGNELIEFVSPLLGLKMAVEIDETILRYEGRHYVLKIGKLLLPVPEWLLLGHLTVVETALDENNFAMDFTLVHPVFGQLYRYAGKFRCASV